VPNRIIKESICTSDTVDGMTWFEECFWQRLIVNCDDYGRFDARPSVLKSRLFPLKERMTLKDVSSALTRLAEIGCVVLYECDGRPYLYLPTWKVHQTQRATKSKYPSPDECVKASEIICKQVQADEIGCKQMPPYSYSYSESYSSISPSIISPAKFKPPTVDEVRAYCKARNNKVDASQFVDFYSSKGWKVGNQPMKDWQAAVRTWEKRGDKPVKRAHNHSTRNYTPEELSAIGRDLLEEV
jgi:hypothetical protein